MVTLDETNRIEYLDCLRGASMILVVYSHLILQWLKLTGSEFFNNYFIIFRMPLFFFISGFFAYKVMDNEAYKKRLKNRVLGQFLPTFVVFALYELCLGEYNMHGFATSIKAGYWFTYVIFFVFMIYCTLSFLLDKVSCTNRIKSMVLFVLALTCFLTINQTSYLYPNLTGVLSLDLVGKFGLFFVLGMISKMYFNAFVKILCNSYITTLCFVLFFILANISSVPRVLIAFPAILFICALFYKYQELFSSKSRLGMSLIKIGRKTLPIYFFHYFVLRLINLSDCVTYFYETNNSLVGGIFLVLSSLFIIAICLMVERILYVFKPLYVILLGPIK